MCIKTRFSGMHAERRACTEQVREAGDEGGVKEWGAGPKKMRPTGSSGRPGGTGVRAVSSALRLGRGTGGDGEPVPPAPLKTARQGPRARSTTPLPRRGAVSGAHERGPYDRGTHTHGKSSGNQGSWGTGITCPSRCVHNDSSGTKRTRAFYADTGHPRPNRGEHGRTSGRGLQNRPWDPAPSFQAEGLHPWPLPACAGATCSGPNCWSGRSRRRPGGGHAELGRQRVAPPHSARPTALGPC